MMTFHTMLMGVVLFIILYLYAYSVGDSSSPQSPAVAA